MKQLEKDWKSFLPYSNKTLDVWERKMRLIDGSSFRKHKNKKTNKKPIGLLERIGSVLENPATIISKMQSVDKDFRMFGDDPIEPSNAGNEGKESGEKGEMTNIEKDERILAGLEDPTSLKYEKYRVECEVFNDSQFYRRMLRELIEIGTSFSGGKKSGKKAVTVDRRAIHESIGKLNDETNREKREFSKNRRRLKFAIRPDMENFMAPRYAHDTEFQVEQLYNSLFQ